MFTAAKLLLGSLSPTKYIMIAMALVIGFLWIDNKVHVSEITKLETEKGQLQSKIATLDANIATQNEAVDEMKKSSDEYKKSLDTAKLENDKISGTLKVKLGEIDKLKFAADCPGKIEQFKIKLMGFGNEK